MERVFGTPHPSVSNTGHGWESREDWAARWVVPSCEHPPSFAALYRLRFTLDEPATMVVHVTADQRYRLWLDGSWVARGSERGMVRSWFYESYELALGTGEHELAALAWYLAAQAPWAQATVGPGFLLAGDEQHQELLSTGIAPWECTVLKGVSFLSASEQINDSVGAGARVRIEGPSVEQMLRSADTTWEHVRATHPGNSGFRQGATDGVHLLTPATVPPMRERSWHGMSAALVSSWERAREPFDRTRTLADEQVRWNALLEGRAAVTVPANTRRRILVDLGEYCCGYCALCVDGGRGSRVSVGWAERLSTEAARATAAVDRHGIDGLYFVGVADEYLPSGHRGERYEPLWWMAGTYVLIEIETAGQPLAVTGFGVTQTGYPLHTVHSFASSAPSLDSIAPGCLRTLQACMHETYMDCPYWEQLQYVGDTRIQALLSYAVAADPRLARKALDIFRFTLNRSGPFIASNCPSRSGQVIAPFALWWVCMLHDYAMWVGEPAFVRGLLPLAWWIVDHFGAKRDERGLARSPHGWNYVDSVAFEGGEPPGSEPGGVSAILNWQLVLAFTALGELHRWCADPERAALAQRLAAELSAACCTAFFDPARGALADDLEHTSCSEHSQSLALLSGTLPETVTVAVERALVSDPDLIRAGPYFTHYVCQAYHRCGAAHTLVARLTQWNRFVDAGLSTFPEHDIVGRSDCHAWSAHPLYHMLTGVLGVCPGDFGFGSVVIEPRLGPLEHASGTVAHPSGRIEVSLDMQDKSLHATVALPPDLPGELRWRGTVKSLRSGSQTLVFR